MIRLALVRTEKQKNYMLQKGRKKIDFKCTAMLNLYSLCERFICQAKTFFFGFSLFLHEKKPPLWVTIGTNTSCAVNSFFFVYQSIHFLHVRTYVYFIVIVNDSGPKRSAP